MWRIQPGTINEHPDMACDLFVIGAGLSGMAASLFAANRGLRVCRIGSSHPLVFHSGLFDVMGMYPVEEKTPWTNPWEAISCLRLNAPAHPYSRLCEESIKQSLMEMCLFFNEEGLPHYSWAGRNADLITAIGTIKTTYLAPLTMWAGIVALKETSPCLIVGIEGFREFSSTQIVETLSAGWPGLRGITIDLPIGASREKSPEHLARALDMAKNRELLAEKIKPHLKNGEAVGLPPILGLNSPAFVLKDMEQKLGTPVFEIPGLPPSVPGIRLKEIFERGLEKKGVRSFYNAELDDISKNNQGDYDIKIKSVSGRQRIRAKGVILASGRFRGKGLLAEGKKISETIFNIPVIQPDEREKWYRKRFLDVRGHPINRSGIVTDTFQRPIDRDGSVFSENLFAAGAILAHQDWTREKCGSGVAVSTAFNAVNSFLKLEEFKRDHHLFANNYRFPEAV